ncbi:MAG TPA: type VII secretion-associated serine protease mycosin [Pseudonocardiaceae bacterium]
MKRGSSARCGLTSRLVRRLVTTALVLAAALSTGIPVAAATTSPSLPGDNSQQCLPAPKGSDTAVPWAQQQLAPQRVWNLTRGAGVTVAVVDTGVDANSPQLAGRVLPGIDVIHTGGGAADTDCYGHGTFVAGIIGAAPAADTGFAGVAPDVTILPIRSATGLQNPASTLAQGIRAAVDAHAQIINVSSSTDVASPDLKSAVDYAASRNVLIVASAANSAQQGDPVTYPASFPSVLAVGAVDSTGSRADFSQTGSYLGLVAPGVNVISIGPGGPGQWEGSGTSYSAPFVAGVAALVHAYRPGLTADQIRHRLEVTADHPAADSLPDPAFGWGMVNPVAAVTAVLPEEGAAGAPVVSPPPAAHPRLPDQDRVGPLVAIVGVLATIVLAFVLRTAWLFGPPGRRRRWRPARVISLLPSSTTPNSAK